MPGITLDVNPTYPLDAAYLDDIGMDFTNKVTVKVNWNGRTPGPVEFWLNNYQWLETADAKGNASHTFQFPGALQPGGNVLSIQASSPTAGGENSAISSFIIYRQSSPAWLTQSRSQGILRRSQGWHGLHARHRLGFSAIPFSRPIHDGALRPRREHLPPHQPQGLAGAAPLVPHGRLPGTRPMGQRT